MKVKDWDIDLPSCDFCKMTENKHTDAPWDSPISGHGAWANMCNEHMAIHGMDLDNTLVLYRNTERDNKDADVSAVQRLRAQRSSIGLA